MASRVEIPESVGVEIPESVGIHHDEDQITSQKTTTAKSTGIPRCPNIPPSKLPGFKSPVGKVAPTSSGIQPPSQRRISPMSPVNSSALSSVNKNGVSSIMDKNTSSKMGVDAGSPGHRRRTTAPGVVTGLRTPTPLKAMTTQSQAPRGLRTPTPLKAIGNIQQQQQQSKTSSIIQPSTQLQQQMQQQQAQVDVLEAQNALLSLELAQAQEKLAAMELSALQLQQQSTVVREQKRLETQVHQFKQSLDSLMDEKVEWEREKELVQVKLQEYRVQVEAFMGAERRKWEEERGILVNDFTAAMQEYDQRIAELTDMLNAANSSGKERGAAVVEKRDLELQTTAVKGDDGETQTMVTMSQDGASQTPVTISQDSTSQTPVTPTAIAVSRGTEPENSSAPLTMSTQMNVSIPGIERDVKHAEIQSSLVPVCHDVSVQAATSTSGADQSCQTQLEHHQRQEVDVEVWKQLREEHELALDEIVQLQNQLMHLQSLLNPTDSSSQSPGQMVTDTLIDSYLNNEDGAEMVDETVDEPAPAVVAGEGWWCDNCDHFGNHPTEECPHSHEIF